MKRLSGALLQAIGDEVRRRRGEAGLTLNALAERAEIHRNYLSKVELGQVDFSISALWSIAAALECELVDLLPCTKRVITPDVLATARMLSDANPAVRSALMTLLGSTRSTRPRWRSGGAGG